MESKPQSRAFLAFNHAELFRSAVGILSSNRHVVGITSRVARNVPNAPFPLLVLAHHATELYLKSILLSIGKKGGGSHDTWKLFNSIQPKENQESIVVYYADLITDVEALFENGIPPPADGHFRTTLKLMGGRFNTLRYVFEDVSKLPTATILNSGFVMEAIRRYATELILLNGDLYMLLVQAEEKDGELVEKPGGEKRPINRDTPSLRDELLSFFRMSLNDDPFSVFKIDPVILRDNSSE